MISMISIASALFRTEPKPKEPVKEYFTSYAPTSSEPTSKPHPIDRLIADAESDFEALADAANQETSTAAQAYRERRGRHPPPGFDEWMEYAVAHDSLVIEEFFDQIYQDLEPFWSVDPRTIRARAASWPSAVITVRNNSASLRQARSDPNDEWVSIWLEAVQGLSSRLPDIDIALNLIDEPRVIVPWEEIQEHIQNATRTKTTREPTKQNPSFNYYSSYEPLSDEPPSADQWEDEDPYWSLARLACPSDSAARTSPVPTDEELQTPPTFDTTAWPDHSYLGYVSNWTLARSVCENPHLRSLHGYLINPLVHSTNTTLLPIFSGCKVSGVNNDILLPPAYYLFDKEVFSGNLDATHLLPWADKEPKAIWRGAANGGSHRRETWGRFHRHRLVSMLNASQVTAAEGLSYPWTPPISAEQEEIFLKATVQNIPMPNASLYPLGALATDPSTLGAWTAQIGDAAFTHFECWPTYVRLPLIFTPDASAILTLL